MFSIGPVLKPAATAAKIDGGDRVLSSHGLLWHPGTVRNLSFIILRARANSLVEEVIVETVIGQGQKTNRRPHFAALILVLRVEGT